MNNSNSEVQNGEAWKNERYFSSYEEAESLKNSLKVKDSSNMHEFKIKRCGEGGKLFVVKSRVSKAALAELEQIEQSLTSKKKQKNKNSK